MLELGQCSVSFEPDSGLDAGGNVTANFYDNVTHTICTMRNNGGLGVICKGLDQPNVVSTRTRDRGPSMLVKLSPNKRMIVLQRDQKSVDILILDKAETSVATEFNVCSKSKEDIIAVDWISNSSILFVTKQCMELMNINVDKKNAKLQKTTNIAVSWSVFNASSNLVLVGTGTNNATLQPFLIQNGQFHRLKSFDVDVTSNGRKETLLEKDVSVASMYGRMYVMILRYRVLNSTSTELAMYELSMDATVPSKLQYTLALGFHGGFGIHMIDNMVVVHHQPSQQSMIFDVAMAPSRPSHSPLITTSIRAIASCLPEPALYNPYWSIFQPDIIADPVAGMMYKLNVNYSKTSTEIEDKSTLIEFLIHRNGQSSLVIRTLYDCIIAKQLTLRQIRKLFSVLAEQCVETPSSAFGVRSPGNSNPVSPIPPVVSPRIEQEELQSGLFIPLKEDPSVDKKFVANIMLQYLRSLNAAKIPVQAYFLELLVEALVEAGEMAVLQQLVTYRVIGDSKPLAFLLLCYEARSPQLYQSGVDILCRQKGVDEIVEVLLDKGFVVDAVRFLDALPQGTDTSFSTAKLVEAARKKNRLVQYAVESRLERNKDKFEELISAIYSKDEIATAEREVSALCE